MAERSRSRVEARHQHQNDYSLRGGREYRNAEATATGKEASKPSVKALTEIFVWMCVPPHLLRHPDYEPSIGLSLCKTRDRVVAEYSLQDVSKTIGVSEYQLAAALPEKPKGTLPTIEEIESELSDSSE